MPGAIGKSSVFERKSRRKKGVMAGLGNERGDELNAPANRGGLDLKVVVEAWPIRGGFTISRGAKHEAIVVVASVSDGLHTGRGECVPYARYGESVEAVVAAIEACAQAIAGGISRTELASLLPAGAARNALDCALWDLEAKRAEQQRRVARRDRRPPACAYRLHPLARRARRDGRQSARGERSPSLAKAQAGRRRGHGPARRGAGGRPSSEAHRRCQRGLATR